MSKEYSPDIIAESFIKQYYELLALNPNELYRFYKEDSFFTHTEGHQTAEVFSGTEKIRARVRELNLAGARFDLSEGSVDAHKSENSGVFVLVTGHCTPAGEETRQFVQSFFLAAQSESPVSYYVRNSMLRLFSSTIAPTVSTGVATEPVPVAAPTVQSTGVNPTPAVEPPTPVVSAAPEKESKKHRGKKETPPPVPAPVPPVVETVPEPVVQTEVETESTMILDAVVVLIEDSTTSELVPSSSAEAAALQQIGEQMATLTSSVDSGPKSYADLFKAKETAPAPAPTAKKQARNANAARKSVETASPPAAAAKSDVTVKPEVGAAPQGKPFSGVSLYVKQLPADITEADLLRIFAGSHRANIQPSKGYGFVEFSEPVFAASNLTRYQEDPSVFSHNGHLFRVEERTLPPKGPGAGHAKGKQQNKQGQTNGNSGGKKVNPKGGEKVEGGWAVKGSNGKK